MDYGRLYPGLLRQDARSVVFVEKPSLQRKVIFRNEVIFMNVELLIGNEAGTKAYQPAVIEGIEWSNKRLRMLLGSLFLKC